MVAEWVVRRGVRGDYQGIFEVQRGCVEAPHWSEMIWAEVLGAGGNRECIVAVAGPVVVGFVVVGLGCEVAELESVAVAAVARRRGIGWALCEAGMAWARGVGASSIELEVRASSRGALALYGALGFSEQGIRMGYYREPAEDAVLMQMVL